MGGSFESGRAEILEAMATGAALGDVLHRLVTLVEQQAEGMLCSIMLLDADGIRIHPDAAPSLPTAYVAQLGAVAVRPDAGSCGAAAYLHERVIVEDIAEHPNWARYRDLALPHGLRACWSSPVLSSTKAVLGTFAMYHREPHRPTAEEVSWVDDATHLAAIAIERDRDLERLRKAEDARRAGEALRAFVFDCVDEIIFTIAVEGPGRYRFLSVNPAFEKATGWPSSEVEGKLITEVIPRASQALVLGKYAEAVANRGRVTWEEVSRYPTGTKHGLVAICPLYDDRGVCTNIVGTVHDITDRVRAQAERDQVQERLLQAQRLQALGTLAGSIARDFNDVLSVILSDATLTAAEQRPSEPLRADVDEIIELAAKRAGEMTRQLLAFSRLHALSPRVLDLHESLAGMERMLQRLLGPDVVLTVVRGPGLWNVRADPGQLEQIVMNLAVNARDAMPRGGKLTIETSNVVLDEKRHVVLAVIDDGVGMDAATRARIFEPFFTTKVEGRGTGLGLTTVMGIVKQLGGKILVSSEPDRGTTFEVCLPAVDDQGTSISA
jgi:PAS domain S-box-containing protein